MELARHDNIIAIKTSSGQIVGFHAHNLQVARLDQLAWQALQPSSKNLLEAFPGALPEALQEAHQEILQWNQEADPNAIDAELPQELKSLTINIAQICNLKCNYCAAGGDGSYGDPMKEIDLKTLYQQIQMVLHDVPEGGAFRFTFLGGEPLVAPNAIRAIHRYSKLQAAGRDIKLHYSIVTNGTLVTPEIAELLASMNCNVTVSIDGPPEVNDRNRPKRSGKGSTEETLRGVRNLLAVKDRLGSLSAGSVFGTHHTDVLATYRFLQPLGFDFLRFDFAAADDDAEASLAYTESLLQTAAAAWELGGERELRKITNFDHYFRLLDEQTRLHNHCGAGKSHLQVDTRGRLYACQWFVNERAEELGQGTKVDHEKLEAYSSSLIEMNNCSSCWARHLCGGGCMFVNKVKTGSKHKKDIHFCTRTRSTIAKGIEYYAEARYQGNDSSTV